MAAYAATVTLSVPHVIKGIGPLGVLFGSVSISNYNGTLAEITDITGAFKGAPVVIPNGVSSNGYLVKWDPTGLAFKCYYPTKAITPAGSVAAGNIAVATGTAGDAVTNNAGTLNSVGGQDVAVAAQAFTGTAVTAQAGTEVATDVNVGIVQFVAFGIAP